MPKTKLLVPATGISTNEKPEEITGALEERAHRRPNAKISTMTAQKKYFALVISNEQFAFPIAGSSHHDYEQPRQVRKQKTASQPMLFFPYILLATTLSVITVSVIRVTVEKKDFTVVEIPLVSGPV
jgi:hypothetical protein